MGIRPMYVFDGKPPDLKAKVLQGRYGRREEAREEQEEEKDIGERHHMIQILFYKMLTMTGFLLV